MIINIKAVGIDMTDALKSYAEEKIMSLTKFFDNMVQADITIEMSSNHHNNGKIYNCHVNLHLPNSKNIFIQKDANDLYKAIDKVKDHLKVELEKIKGKMRSHDREAIREQKAYNEDETEQDLTE